MSDIDAGIVKKVARAISAAGMAWLKEQDPLGERLDFGWADVPDEVFARAAISAYEEARAGELGFISKVAAIDIRGSFDDFVCGMDDTAIAVARTLYDLVEEARDAKAVTDGLDFIQRTVDVAAAKTIKSNPILDAIKASVPNLSEWTITSDATGTLFFDTHGGIITQAEKQSIRDAILGQLPSTPPVNVFFKDDI